MRNETDRARRADAARILAGLLSSGHYTGLDEAGRGSAQVTRAIEDSMHLLERLEEEMAAHDRAHKLGAALKRATPS